MFLPSSGRFTEGSSVDTERRCPACFLPVLDATSETCSDACASEWAIYELSLEAPAVDVATRAVLRVVS
jgi:hypothetical protein